MPENPEAPKVTSTALLDLEDLAAFLPLESRDGLRELVRFYKKYRHAVEAEEGGTILIAQQSSFNTKRVNFTVEHPEVGKVQGYVLALTASERYFRFALGNREFVVADVPLQDRVLADTTRRRCGPMTDKAENKELEAFRQWQAAVHEADRVASDPFKAPEQVLACVKPVLDAAWNLQIEYIVARRADA